VRALDEFMYEGSLSLSQARAMIADPDQLAPQAGRLLNVGEINMKTAPFDSTHPTYSTNIAGHHLGRLAGDFNFFEAKPSQEIESQAKIILSKWSRVDMT
jgi:hypothetical protein